MPCWREVVRQEHKSNDSQQWCKRTPTTADLYNTIYQSINVVEHQRVSVNSTNYPFQTLKVQQRIHLWIKSIHEFKKWWVQTRDLLQKICWATRSTFPFLSTDGTLKSCTLFIHWPWTDIFCLTCDRKHAFLKTLDSVTARRQISRRGNRLFFFACLFF